jgi:hypothetical protein
LELSIRVILRGYGLKVGEVSRGSLPPWKKRSEMLLQHARMLMSFAILRGTDISGRRIEIRNGAGEVVMVVPFAAAIEPEA